MFNRKSYKTLLKYNDMERIVHAYCNFTNEKALYELYLKDLIPVLERKKKNPDNIRELKEYSHDSCVKLIAIFLKNRDLFKIFAEKLPEPVMMLIYMFTWEFDSLDTTTAEEKVFQLLGKKLTCKGKEMPLDEIIEQDPVFFLFQSNKVMEYRKKRLVCIAIDSSLQKKLRKVLPEPEFAAPVAEKEISSKVTSIHQDNQNILKRLPAIVSFIHQGRLKFNKAGNSLLKSSLKQMADLCSMTEYYASGDKEIANLKTQLIGDFFASMSRKQTKELQDVPGFLKKMVTDFLTHDDFKVFPTGRVLHHIKYQKEPYNSDKNEIQIRKNLHKIIKMLPEDKWMSINSLAHWAFYRGIDLNPFESSPVYYDLQVRMESQYSFQSSELFRVIDLSSLEVIALPLLKMMMFLFAALGVVDIGYSSPENRVYQSFGKPWLSVYDGLQYVRLTDLGSWITGRTDHFEQTITIESAEVELNDQKTIVSLYGKDAVKEMILETMGQQITQTSYMLNYQSFLKECKSASDVEKKINLFRENIEKNPPAVWEEFFKEVTTRINPLKKINSVSTFKVQPDRDLLTLLTTDKLLKQKIIRAQDYHVVIKNSDMPGVKKRLADFGFFIS
ncbi:MAG: hypothetical protein U9P10_01850 [Thermodesulfobacteriota bacterium]|nr:hypothetical protein [Thermodesulfobacteriota bacterium]